MVRFGYKVAMDDSPDAVGWNSNDKPGMNKEEQNSHEIYKFSTSRPSAHDIRIGLADDGLRHSVEAINRDARIFRIDIFSYWSLFHGAQRSIDRMDPEFTMRRQRLAELYTGALVGGSMPLWAAIHPTYTSTLTVSIVSDKCILRSTQAAIESGHQAHSGQQVDLKPEEARCLSKHNGN